jgi:hypothetical protein
VASIFNPDDPLSTAPPDARPAPASEAYAAMSDDELLRWVDHPEARLAVARELGRRDGIRFSGPIGRALRLLPAQSAAELAAELVKGGDALGDVWIELIASRRRGASAIGVVGAGVLHLRRALSPLVQRALAKDNEDWKLAAWAAGQFGVAAVRALTRVETDQSERLAWVLGHAVRCGAAKELERARVGAVPVFLEAGTRALALQDEVRAYDDALKKHEGNTEIRRRSASAALGRVKSASRTLALDSRARGHAGSAPLVSREPTTCDWGSSATFMQTLRPCPRWWRPCHARSPTWCSASATWWATEPRPTSARTSSVRRRS